MGDTNGNRYQQVYSSSFFAPVGPQQEITSVAFRPKQGAFLTFIGSTLNISNITIQLSTTPRNADTDFPNGLNADLASNVGPDATVVYSGPLSLSTDRVLGDNDVEDFDFLINFATPFLYRPELGNLLLEVIIPPGAIISSTNAAGARANNFPQLDTFTDGFPSRDGTASANDANLLDGLTIGSNTTTGVVTQFQTTAVPEPASLVLWGLISAAGGVAVWRRPRRRAATL